MKDEKIEYSYIKKRLKKLEDHSHNIYGLDEGERQEYRELQERLRVFLKVNPQYAI